MITGTTCDIVYIYKWFIYYTHRQTRSTTRFAHLLVKFITINNIVSPLRSLLLFSLSQFFLIRMEYTTGRHVKERYNIVIDLNDFIMEIYKTLVSSQ